MAVRTRLLAVAATLGAAAGLPGYWAVNELQFAVTGGWAWLPISVAAGFGVPFVLAVHLGGRLAARRTQLRMPAQVAALAERYEIDRDALAELARAAASL